jgi:hypothetical protein
MSLIAVISDLHAFLGPTEEALRLAREAGADSVVCLGDVIGYGPQPCEVVDRIRREVSVVLRGNHEDALAGGRSLEEMNDTARAAILRHRTEIGDERIAWLTSLPLTTEIGSLQMAHASVPGPERFRYVTHDGREARTQPDFWIDAHEAGRAMRGPLLFVGHSHVPTIYHVKGPGRCALERPSKPQYRFLETGRWIVDVGSVGAPRIGRSSFVLVDDDARLFRYVRF